MVYDNSAEKTANQKKGPGTEKKMNDLFGFLMEPAQLEKDDLLKKNSGQKPENAATTSDAIN